jgi:putative transposase
MSRASMEGSVDECLNEQVFASLRDAREKIEAWRVDYNQNRPHSGINNLTPHEFAEITRLKLAQEIG